MSNTANLPLSDRALQPGETDLLGRGAFVRNLAKILCNAPKGDSVVFALYGKWGEGKTSTLSLLDKELQALKENDKDIPVVIRFNPWVFSGREHLFNAFFEDIGNAIGESTDSNRVEAAKRWKRIGAYSQLAGTAIGGINSALGVFGASIPCGEILSGLLKKVTDVTASAAEADKNAKAKSLLDLRKEMEEALITLQQPLLVILDDLDRLPPAELAEIFQLLKSTVDLPNVHYLLLCDRGNIERNLEKQGLRPDYLEKIVQFGVSLPAIPDAVLHELLITQLQAIFDKFAGNDTRVNEELWSNIRTSAFPEVFETLRDVKRFVGEFRMILPAFCEGGYFELNPEHFLKLQALRLFCPSVVELIRANRKIYRTSENSAYLEELMGNSQKNQKKQFAAETIPEYLKAKKLSGYLPLVQELLLIHGQDASSGQNSIEDRHFTSAVWHEAYFTLEIPQNAVAISDIDTIRHNLHVGHEKLVNCMQQVISRSGRLALARCLVTKFSHNIEEIGQKLISAYLSCDRNSKWDENLDNYWFPINDYFERWLRQTPEIERKNKLLELLRTSRNHDYFSSLLYDARHVSSDGSLILRYVNPSVDSLGKATAVIIEEKSANGVMLLQKGFWNAQDVWLDWGSKSKFKSWIRKVIATDHGLKEYLLALGGYCYAYDGEKREEYFWLNHHRLFHLPDFRASIGRCIRLLASCQDPREAMLWESALNGFKAQSEYRKGFEFLRKYHPNFFDARFHAENPNHFNHDTMAVITAENPRGETKTLEENQKLTKSLANELQNRGISSTVLAVGAADGSHLEQSFLISTNLETAIEIGRKFDQVAVFMIYNKDSVDIVACEGEGKYRLGNLSQIAVWSPLPKTQIYKVTGEEAS